MYCHSSGNMIDLDALATLNQQVGATNQPLNGFGADLGF